MDTNTQKDILAKSFIKGIAYAENGGKPNLDDPSAGKTGETKSIFQFTPGTWKSYSKEAFGKDDVPLNNDTETYVAYKKAKDWIDKGYTVRQMASMWNAGEGEKDAYTGKFSNGNPSKGVNKQYNEPFDVPAYANKVLNYSKQFYDENIQKAQQQQQEQKIVGNIKNIVSQASNGSGASSNIALPSQPANSPQPQA